MPFFQLNVEEISFPPAYFADSEGLIAVGGDLKHERVLKAYQNGIYFWFGPMDPIKWWSPDPRLVLDPISTEQGKTLNKKFEIVPTSNFNTRLFAFQTQENTGKMGPNWITEEMKVLYSKLYNTVNAQILDINYNGKRFSSVLGITIGSAFFIEYILVHDPSNVGKCVDQSVLAISAYLRLQAFMLIDVQKESLRISDIEIHEISRLEYLDQLQKAISKSPIPFIETQIEL